MHVFAHCETSHILLHVLFKHVVLVAKGADECSTLESTDKGLPMSGLPVILKYQIRKACISHATAEL